MSCLLLDFFSLFVLLLYVIFPNANLLVFLFPGFIVIPKPSQLSQWNSSIATIFLLLKNPATQSLMLLFTLQALQVFLFFDCPTPPCPYLPPSLTLPTYLPVFVFFVFVKKAFLFFSFSHSLDLVED